MTSKAQDKLLVELLNQQVDAGDGDDLSEARIEQALTTGPGFSDTESQLLWRTPIARSKLSDVRERLRHGIVARWQASNIEPVALLRAAADDADGVIKVRGDGFTLTIFPDADPAMPWILSLKIDQHLHKDLPNGFKLQLVDSGGMTWLTGRPNSRGEINDGWIDISTSPRERLQTHYLRLTPV